MDVHGWVNGRAANERAETFGAGRERERGSTDFSSFVIPREGEVSERSIHSLIHAFIHSSAHPLAWVGGWCYPTAGTSARAMMGVVTPTRAMTAVSYTHLTLPTICSV